MILDMDGIIKVSIHQFYGIEINDFAVKVAKTALWIAEAQMWSETKKIISSTEEIEDFLPLDSYENIIEGNALQIDWNSIISDSKCNYIMGNPPFIGGMYMTNSQKKEIKSIFEETRGVGEFDYVTAWYKKSCDYINNTNIKVAFVSTNSICQGEQVITFWKYLFCNYKINIDFAYTTFIWNNEANNSAKVHCVIVGFSNNNSIEKLLYTDINKFKSCKNINPYLSDGPNIFIESRSNPICNVPQMRFGSMPRDGGGFILTPEQKQEFIKLNPLSKKWIKPYVGADQFLNNKERYCLWLYDAEPGEINKCPMVKKRVEFVKDFRINSKAEGTRKFANTPTLFCQIAQPNTDYIIIPKTSSGKRRYIPIGFMDKNTIASDLVFLIPNATLYEFGILSSNVHMAWMRMLCGRLKSDYRYSKDIVYNNFPWPKITKQQKNKIEKTAQLILEIRKKYISSTLANLYDENIMPSDLRKAHQLNDKMVWEAYGKKWNINSESECVSKLLELYNQYTIR